MDWIMWKVLFRWIFLFRIRALAQPVNDIFQIDPHRRIVDIDPVSAGPWLFCDVYEILRFAEKLKIRGKPRRASSATSSVTISASFFGT